MYSSCRNAVVQVIETSLNIALEKKLEISSGSELTEQFLQVMIDGGSDGDSDGNVCSFQSELHPVVSLNRPKFSKPPGPSRGQKRMTKTPA